MAQEILYPLPHDVRAFVPGGTSFFAVALWERHRRLLIDPVTLLRRAFAEVRQKRPVTIEAIVVLPNHLHCVWTLPDGDGDCSTRWQSIKWCFSRAIPAGERRSARRISKGERGIGQCRFWEPAMRDATDFARHGNAIHSNPVNQGHARCAADWPDSSFSRFVAAGTSPIDWAALSEVQGEEFEDHGRRDTLRYPALRAGPGDLVGEPWDSSFPKAFLISC